MPNTSEIKSLQDLTNVASVAYYTDKIKSEIKTSTGAWRNVAGLFAAAFNEFDDEFQKFINDVTTDTIITSKEVNDARVKEAVKFDPYQTVFSIQIDVNAIKAKMFSGEDYKELVDAIETIQNTMNYVRVQETNLFENDAARFHAELNREYNKQVRKAWNDEKKKFIARSKCEKTIAEVKKDIQAQFNDGDYDTAFSFIGSDAFDQNKIMNIAAFNVYEKREEKFSLKTSAADAFANTEIQVAA